MLGAWREKRKMQRTELVVVPLNKEKLEKIPPDERTLFVQVSTLNNEINVFQKILLYCSTDNEDKFFQKAAVTQQQIIARILIGKLYEGWMLFQSDFFRSKLSEHYEKQLRVDGKKSLQELKKYFSNRNFIKEIRNSHSFHYDPDTIVPTIEKLPEELDIELILAPDIANSLAYFAEEIITRSMISIVKEIKGIEEDGDAYSALYKDLIFISSQFMETIGEIMVIIAQKYLGNSFEEMGANKETIEVDSIIDEIHIPYFVNKPRVNGV